MKKTITHSFSGALSLKKAAAVTAVLLSAMLLFSFVPFAKPGTKTKAIAKPAYVKKTKTAKYYSSALIKSSLKNLPTTVCSIGRSPAGPNYCMNTPITFTAIISPAATGSYTYVWKVGTVTLPVTTASFTTTQLPVGNWQIKCIATPIGSTALPEVWFWGNTARTSALSGSTCQPPATGIGGSFSSRKNQPVTIKGSKISELSGYLATNIVGFVYKNSEWKQIPVQVDEMKLGVRHDVLFPEDISSFAFTSTPQYCDATTDVGPDSGNLNFDADDEISFMARDASSTRGTGYPTNVNTASAVEVKVTNPTNSSEIAYIYLFERSNSSIIPSAGIRYVDYAFNLTAGSYNPNYHTQVTSLFPNNPETSTVITPYYQTGFIDRWIQNSLKITIDNSAGLNILDRYKFRLSPGDCSRTEETFCTYGEEPDVPEDKRRRPYGAFFCNINGPIRGIRSYIGANSGKLTQRDNFFYEDIEVIKTYLRVHDIPLSPDHEDGLTLFYDYDPAAGPMLYNDNNNYSNTFIAGGVTYKGHTIDGVPNTLSLANELTWQLINSNSGSVFRYWNLYTAPYITAAPYGPLPKTTYFKDLTNAGTLTTPGYQNQCTGDNHAYGASGFRVDAYIPDTRVGNPSGSDNPVIVTQVNLHLTPSSDRDNSAAYLSRITPFSVPDGDINPYTGSSGMMTITPPSAPLISVYPSPSTGIFTVEVEADSKQKVAIIIYNSRGQKVYTRQQTGPLKETVDLHASSGMGQLYIAKITIDGKTTEKKILVNK